MEARQARQVAHEHDVFLSYRVDADQQLVELLYLMLRLKGLAVYWDVESLEDGQDFVQGFVTGISSTCVFVPVLSRKGLESFSRLECDSRCDNVLLEHRMALELEARGCIRAIFPVFVGNLENPPPRLGGEPMYSDFFKGSPPCTPETSSVTVNAVEAKVFEFLQRHEQVDFSEAKRPQTVKGALNEIMSKQGVMLRGDRKLANENAVNRILSAVEKNRSTPSRMNDLLRQRQVSLASNRFSTGDLSDGDADCNEVVRFLEGKGLTKIAVQFSEAMGMELVEDLSRLQEPDLNDADLSFLKRWQKQKLLELARDLAANALCLNESELSGADTSDDEVSEPERSDHDLECIAIKHPGSPDDFQEHMGGFIRDLFEFMEVSEADRDTETETFDVPLSGSPCRWSYCMLVWLSFAKEATMSESSRKGWLECIRSPTQDILLGNLTWCLKMPSTAHPLWARDEFQLLKCSKESAAAVFVTDCFVRHHLGESDRESLRVWQQDVTRDWFENEESASVFLVRANRFLREHVLDGVSVLQHVVETKSYVALMFARRLASLLLFETLEARKVHGTSAGEDVGESLHGFRMLVSSSPRVFGLSAADVPAPGAMTAVFDGLRCLSRLTAQGLSAIGPATTCRQYLVDLGALDLVERLTGRLPLEEAVKSRSAEGTDERGEKGICACLHAFVFLHLGLDLPASAFFLPMPVPVPASVHASVPCAARV